VRDIYLKFPIPAVTAVKFVDQGHDQCEREQLAVVAVSGKLKADAPFFGLFQSYR
jgi:hypothetical protein